MPFDALPKVFPSVRIGHKICVKQCFSTNMFWLKDVATSNDKLVNITFTPQRHTYIYSLLVHESIVDNLPCTYFVTNGVFPSCTCLHFVSNAPSFKHSYFLSYKHMYYMYNVHMSLVVDIRIHQPSLNRNDVDVNLFVLLDSIFGNIVSNS
jgi:hypothetical protein